MSLRFLIIPSSFLLPVVATSSSPTLLYGSTCDPTLESNIQISSSSGQQLEQPSCAPQCSDSGSGLIGSILSTQQYSCPDPPSGPGLGKPVCILSNQQSNQNFCALTCTEDGHCPGARAGSCKTRLINKGNLLPGTQSQTGQQDASLGICVVPTIYSGSTLTSNSQKVVKVNVNYQLLGGPSASNTYSYWENLGKPRNTVEAVKILENKYAVLKEEESWRMIREGIAGPYPTPPSSSTTSSTSLSAQQSIKLNPLDGKFVDDLVHDVKYLEKHIMEGDFLKKELHDTYWNLTHLSSSGAYALLHGILSLLLIYCLLGCCLKRVVFGYNEISKQSLPHLEFWENYPDLVYEGILVSYNFVKLEIWSRIKDQNFNQNQGQVKFKYNLDGDGNQGYDYNLPSAVGRDSETLGML